MDILSIAVAIAFAVALIMFFLRLITLYRYMGLGKAFNSHANPLRRFGFMIYDTFSQSCSRSHKNYYSGVTHFIFFWGFIILLPSIANLILGPLTGFNWEFLGPALYDALFFAEDILIVIILVGVAMALYRRMVIKPKKLENTFDSYFILLLVIILMISLLFHNAFDIVLSGTAVSYMPVSQPVANYISAFHLSHASIIDWFYTFYWIHVLTILVFLVYIPYSKHMHLLAAFPNIFLKPDKPRGELKYVDIEKSEIIGASSIRDLTWKDYLDGMACTECGRCTDNCPAFNTGKLLNPKKIISKVKHNLYHNAPIILRGGEKIASLIGKEANDYTVTEEELWDCTTCGACLEQCPVYNDHIGKIVDMRRYLVMMEGIMPKEIMEASTNTERTGNPWGFPSAKRGDLAMANNVRTIKEGPAEYLLFSGCAGSYDPDYRSAMEATIGILQKANVSFATLGNEEVCCGDSARRNGNEYLYQTLAKKNVETFNKYGVNKIIFTCPHCYNTVKNEYPQFGGKFEAYHYTEILEDLLRQEKVKLKPNSVSPRSTFQDPCYLGRYNNIYDKPRNVMAPIVQINEMNKNREDSFCCGGGSGKFLTEDSKGERINVARTKQALELNVEQIVTACPYCKLMLEDGLKHEKREDVVVTDLSELVLRNVE